MNKYEVIDGVRYYDAWNAFEPDGSYWKDDDGGIEWAVVQVDDGQYALAV